jgi:hypothetical protein
MSFTLRASIFMALLCWVTVAAYNQTLREGVGLDTLPIIGMKRADVIRIFGREFDSYVNKVVPCDTCGKYDHREVRVKNRKFMSYRKVGLTILLGRNMRVQSVAFSNPAARTTKGIRVGSTAAEVVAVYGQLPMDEYMRYVQHGVAFSFSEGIVEFIELFSPR